MSYREYYLVSYDVAAGTTDGKVVHFGPTDGKFFVWAVIARVWNDFQELIEIQVSDTSDKRLILKKAVDKYLNDKSCTLTNHSRMSIEECDAAIFWSMGD